MIISAILLIVVLLLMQNDEAGKAAKAFVLSDPNILEKCGSFDWAHISNLRHVSGANPSDNYRTYRFLTQSKKGCDSISIAVCGWPSEPKNFATEKRREEWLEKAGRAFSAVRNKGITER